MESSRKGSRIRGMVGRVCNFLLFVVGVVVLFGSLSVVISGGVFAIFSAYRYLGL